MNLKHIIAALLAVSAVGTAVAADTLRATYETFREIAKTV